jgi:hypothetical protein
VQLSEVVVTLLATTEYLRKAVANIAANYIEKPYCSTLFIAEHGKENGAYPIGEIEVLFAKELYDLCFQRLHKALEKTEKFERFPSYIKLLILQRKLITATSAVN